MVENLSIDQRGHNELNEVALPPDDIASWLARGLVDAGATKLLRMSNHDVHDEGNSDCTLDTKTTSDTLFCDVLGSPLRR